MGLGDTCVDDLVGLRTRVDMVKIPTAEYGQTMPTLPPQYVPHISELEINKPLPHPTTTRLHALVTFLVSN